MYKTLFELIQSGYQKKKDLNCAEAILWGANEAYDMGLSQHSLKLAAGFGGGISCEKECGVVTGMAMVLSHLYANGRGHTSPEMREMIQEAICAFEEKFKSTNCARLKADYRTEEAGCHALIAAGAEILDRLVQ